MVGLAEVTVRDKGTAESANIIFEEVVLNTLGTAILRRAVQAVGNE